MNKIIGRHSVLEAIRAGKKIEKIYFRYGIDGAIIHQTKKIALEHNIKFEFLDKARFDKLAAGTKTQGVIAITNPINFLELDELINNSLKSKNFPILILLENLQDTQNIGAIIRTAECLGIDGVIITKDNTAPIDENTFRASAGAIEFIPISKITNVSQSIDYLKQKGFWIIGTSDHSEKSLTEIKLDFPSVIIFGNESKGIKKLTESKCDFLIKIPMKGKISSLNVSSAAAIILYEFTRSR